MRGVFSCPYLSQLVGLFSLGHGGPGSERLVGLSNDAGTHFVCCLLLCFLRGNTCSWSGRAQVCSRAGEPPIYVNPPRQRGGKASHRAGGLTPGGWVWGVFWEMTAAVWTIWSHWAPATSAGMRSFVRMLRLIAFTIQNLNVHQIKLRKNET